ncbi:DNA topoisomerase I [Candidatus Pacearchaeota archaeon]|nr:DNA topoisomerase I [Candidatus Pacearchaeota archaeon]
MRKKPQKTKEETASETFFRVDENDLKSTTIKEEKPEVQNIKVSVEKPFKGKENPIEVIKQSRVRKTRKPSKKMLSFKFKKGKTFGKKIQGSFAKKPAIKEHKIPQISLKKNSYELIITEKPQAASKIAEALGKARKLNDRGIAYYEVSKQGKEIIVACAVGHLFTLSQNISGSSFPIFDISWKPNYLVRKGDFTKKYYDTLLSLAKNAGSLTVATDYDIEGEVIGVNVVKYICGQKDANRMKFSTLTSKELNQAYEEKSSSLNWGQAIAGETRHFLDWFYGINLSRALMQAIKSTGKFKIMSIGRVQGPTLHLIVEKEREIQAFKPVPYWQIFITVKNSHTLELKHNKDIFNKQELGKFENLNGKIGIAETSKKEEVFPPQPPFNLTTLQTEAYKFYGITPARTLQIAQSLYLAGLISYPRTSSQQLPASIAYKEILDKVSDHFKASHLIKRQKPIEGKKTDPAHPSIYPTGNFQILSGDDEKTYNLIAKRFISLFCEDAIVDKKKITVNVDNFLFSTEGSSIRKKAWMEVYPSKLKEVEVPDMNGKVKVIDSKIEEKETQPPRRYSPASILTELEKKNLGTKATRANILETLYDRGYIKGTSIEATSLGISLVETLEKFSPIIIDENLTRSFEDSMEAIQNAKDNLQEKEEKIIEKAKKTITLIAKTFESNYKGIGEELVNADTLAREQQKEENKLIKCPVCSTGDLIINYSKKTRRYFIACNAYPNCRNTSSLPPDSLIKKTDKTCEKCGYPMLISIKKGKKPWIFCFNKECEINKQRLEEYRRRQEENNANSNS